MQLINITFVKWVVWIQSPAPCSAVFCLLIITTVRPHHHPGLDASDSSDHGEFRLGDHPPAPPRPTTNPKPCLAEF